MAIDQESIALDIASQIVSATDRFMTAVEDFTNLLDWATDAGINMADHDTALAESGELKHVDGATINKLATVIPDLVSHLDTNLVSGTASGVWLQKIRRA